MKYLHKVLVPAVFSLTALTPFKAEGFWIRRAPLQNSVFDRMEEMQRDMDRLFQDVFRMTKDASPQTSQRGLDVETTKDATIITVGLPGFTIDDVNIEVKEERKTKYLVISAKQAEEKEEKKEPEKGADEKEYRYARTMSKRQFHYSYMLGDRHKDDKIEANLKDGLLRIVIPMKEEVKKEKSRMIKISSD